MRAFLQPISARICFGKTASHLLRCMFSYAMRPNGRSFFVYGTAGRCGISPYGRFAAPLCRAGPACPAGINAYCAAGHMGPALRIILRPLRCRASPTGGRRDGRPCPPEQREALSFRASDRVTGVGIRIPLCGGVRAPHPTACAVTLRRGRRPRRPTVGADDSVRPQGTGVRSSTNKKRKPVQAFFFDIQVCVTRPDSRSARPARQQLPFRRCRRRSASRWCPS